MTQDDLAHRLRQISQETVPFPGFGNTAERHRHLTAVGREDLTLAKLAEAHWDATAILNEAGRTPVSGALYAVWASEVPSQPMALESGAHGFTLSGSKPFCSGLGLVDRALITAGGPVASLIEVDLTQDASRIAYDLSVWKVGAFEATQTGSLTLSSIHVPGDSLVGDPGWYLDRPGFWHGACGPAACWAGGIAGLLDYARASKRSDPHTLAHLAAMEANVWAMEALLERAGREIDAAPNDRKAAMERALKLRHLIETLASDCLRRFPRAYGPHPLSMNADISRRYHEADLYLRQSHAERDLETLGRLVTSPASGN